MRPRKLSDKEHILKAIENCLFDFKVNTNIFYAREMIELKAEEILSTIDFYDSVFEQQERIENKYGNNRATTETTREGLLEGPKESLD